MSVHMFICYKVLNMESFQLNISMGVLLDDNYTTNASYNIEDQPKLSKEVELLYKVLVNGVLTMMMLSMGCEITLGEIIATLKNPRGVVIGATSQFIVLPLAAFGLAHAFQLNKYHAISMMVVSCCPGGSLSNVITFWSRGNVTLRYVISEKK